MTHKGKLAAFKHSPFPKSQFVRLNTLGTNINTFILEREHSQSQLTTTSFYEEPVVQEDDDEERKKFWDGNFNLRRMLRQTSNDMDSDPRFFQ